jgi:hypothetical protein
VELDSQRNTFVCPECTGSKTAAHLHVIPLSTDLSPWARVYVREVCASCRRVVPTPLAERWKGETLDEARETWRRLFREHPQSGPLPTEVLKMIGELGQSAEPKIAPDSGGIT